MQEHIEQADRRFRRIWLFTNMGWTMIALGTLSFTTFIIFSNHPEYLHDWRGIAIPALALLSLALYSSLIYMATRRGHGFERWSPPRWLSIPYMLGIYLSITLLTMIDNNFTWSYYIALGLSFALFEAKIVTFLAVPLFLSLSWFLGLFTWPLSADVVSAFFGSGTTFASLVIVCFTLQHMIGERFERTHLLEEVARSKEELETAHRQLSETAVQEQELAVLRERTRLAREMHDTLGHALVLISVKLEAAQRLRTRDPQRCDQELEETREIVRTSMNELRASIANLRSPVLEREPAGRALSRYAREMAQRIGLRVSYDLHPDSEGLPESLEETLWKIGQEALTNIEKHACARNVLLHISRRDSQIWLRIEDDGIGLPTDLCQTHATGATRYESPEGHYGLSGMRERANQAGGHFSLSTRREGGTIIEVSLPLVEAPFVTD